MRGVEATTEQMEAFAAALDKQLMGRSNQWLATALAEEMGEPAETAEAVRHWHRGTREPGRAKVFAMERIFGLKPGAMSALLGYLPVEAKPIRSVEEAVAFDARLDDKDREVLVQFYRSRFET